MLGRTAPPSNCKNIRQAAVAAQLRRGQAFGGIELWIIDQIRQDPLTQLRLRAVEYVQQHIQGRLFIKPELLLGLIQNQWSTLVGRSLGNHSSA